MSRFKRLAKEGGWIVAGQIAAVAGSLVLVRVLTGYLDPIQYGQLALGLTLAGLVNQVVMGGITAGTSRFYSIATEKQDLRGYIHATRRLLIYATLVVVVVGSVLLCGMSWLGFSQWIGLAIAALVFSVLSGCNSTLSGIQNAARQRAIVAFHGGLDAWLKVLLAVVFTIALGSTSTAVVIGYAVSSMLITLSQLIFLRRTVPLHQTHVPDHQAWVRQIWGYSWPFSAWGIFTWMQQASDRWALQTFASTTEVGQYSVLFQLGYTPIALATGIAISFLGPILFNRSGDATDLSRQAGVHQLTQQFMMSCLLLTLIGFLLALGLHKQIFSLLVAKGYRSVSYLLPWVVLAGGLFAAGQMLALRLMSDMKPALMTRAKIGTALIGVAFNVWGAAVAGLNGIVCALLGFSAIYLGMMTLLAFRTDEMNK